jgi:hypothetical protein
MFAADLEDEGCEE